jgi:oxysterol-binding protein-related protein 8
MDIPFIADAPANEGSFMAHPETLLPMPEIDDPTERFISVVKFYLSGWHIKPP